MLKPYEFSHEITKEGHLYLFTNSSGVTFTCFFLDYSSFFTEPPQVFYGVNFAPNTSNPMPFDERNAHTICHIVNHFMNSVNGAIIFVCDSLDSRELMRLKLFTFWEIRFGKPMGLKLIKRIFDYEDGIRYSIGFIVETNDNNDYFSMIDMSVLN